MVRSSGGKEGAKAILVAGMKCLKDAAISQADFDVSVSTLVALEEASDFGLLTEYCMKQERAGRP
jgi:hypothetical protein